MPSHEMHAQLLVDALGLDDFQHPDHARLCDVRAATGRQIEPVHFHHADAPTYLGRLAEGQVRHFIIGHIKRLHRAVFKENPVGKFFGAA